MAPKLPCYRLSNLLGSFRSRKKTKWDDLLAGFTQNSLIEPTIDPITNGHTDIKSSKKVPFDPHNQTKIDKDHELSFTPDEVYSFLNDLTNDEEFLQATALQPEQAAKSIAAALNKFPEEPPLLDLLKLIKNESHVTPLLEIIVLKFPDSSQDIVFKIYKLQVNAVSSLELLAGYGTQKSGLSGSFDCRTYKQRNAVIDGLKEETKHTALSQLSHILSG